MSPRHRHKSPAFQLYTKDLLSDGRVLAMTLEQFGAYIKLLAICWNEGGLPNDLDALARMTACERTRFEELFSGISSCFYLDRGGRWQQKRLDIERAKQVKNRKQRQLAAEARWQRERDARNADALRETSLASAIALATAVKKEDPPIGPVRAEARFNASDPIDSLASDFLERYPEVYARVRNGATYRTTSATYERDLRNARGLATAYPDLNRLLTIAEVFLRAKNIGDKNQPGTPGQLLHMAPEFDGLLKANGR